MDFVENRAIREAGWVDGDAADFLGLDDNEARLIDLKISIGHAVKRLREAKKLSQAQLAAAVGTSASRVAKLEGASPGVTLDAMIKALFLLGGSLADLDGPSTKPRLPARVRASRKPGTGRA